MQHSKERLIKFRTKVFKALGDSYRLQIIEYLRNGEKCVCDIVPHIGIIQPVVSRHLKILKNAGLVKDRKDGNRRLYSITDPRIFEIVDSITPELVDSLSRRIIAQII